VALLNTAQFAPPWLALLPNSLLDFLARRAERSSAHREIVPNLPGLLRARALEIEPELSQLECAKFLSSTTVECFTPQDYQLFNQYLRQQFPALNLRVIPIVEKGTKLFVLGMDILPRFTLLPLFFVTSLLSLFSFILFYFIFIFLGWLSL
jgi:hypothetical protein